MNLTNAMNRALTIIFGIAAFEVVQLGKPLWVQFAYTTIFVFACIIDTLDEGNKTKTIVIFNECNKYIKETSEELKNGRR